jgi:hypothetical protein
MTHFLSGSFYFNDGLGNVVDEYGNGSMDIIKNEDPFKLEESSYYSTYIEL